MPELPEVETIARILRQGINGMPGLLGQTITQAEVFWERSLALPSPSTFIKQIPGLTFQNVSRRGKFLVMDLKTHTLLVHLRMSGDLRVEHASQPIQKHDRISLLLENQTRLVFNDTRKFGRMWFTATPETVLEKLGPEPLDIQLDEQSFYDSLHTRNRQLKPLLLDQTFLAGLGNIYTDEALHIARLHPMLLSNRVTPDQTSQLLHAIRTVLQDGIDRNGSSIDWVYRGGTFQNQFQVYGRTGKACLNCGALITRILVGQRSTHFCPNCQPLTMKKEV